MLLRSTRAITNGQILLLVGLVSFGAFRVGAGCQAARSQVRRTLPDAALMGLDWYGRTRRDAGLKVIATRNIPGPGIEIDVRTRARPEARRPAYDPGLQWVSSTLGGAGAIIKGWHFEGGERLVFALDVELTAVDGAPPTWTTPAVSVSLLVNGIHERSTRLTPFRWKRTISEKWQPWQFEDVETINEVGLSLLRGDDAWRSRDAVLTFRVTQPPDVVLLNPNRRAVPERATLSPAALGSLVLSGGETVPVQDAASASSGVDLRFTLEGRDHSASLRLDDAMQRLVNHALGDRFDEVALRVRLLEVDGHKRDSRMFAVDPGSFGQRTDLSLGYVEHSGLITLKQNWRGAPGERWWSGIRIEQNYGPDLTRGPRVQRMTLRLEPVLGATLVP